MIFTRKMKKILLASAILAMIAVVLCIVGYVSAKVQNKALFDQTQNDDGNYIHIHDFDTSAVKKISIEVSFANVNIIGGAAIDRIELVNFPIEEFKIVVGATTVAIEEKSGMSGLFSMNFGGLRNYLNSLKMAYKEKTVNIYLSDSSAMKLLYIDVYSGNVNVKGLELDTDLTVKNDYGTLTVDGYKTEGTLKADIKEGNVDIMDSEIKRVETKIALGYTNLEKTVITELETDISKGYFKYNTGGDKLLSSVLRLKTENGRVRFGGDIYESGSFSQGMEYTGVSGVTQTVIKVSVAEGNIMITE